MKIEIVPEILSDKSKVYNVIVDSPLSGKIEFACLDEYHARSVYSHMLEIQKSIAWFAVTEVSD